MKKFLEFAKPTNWEMEQLALRETDPKFHAEFEPFARGPLFAVSVLVFVVLCGIVAIPLRLAKRIMQVRR